MQKNYHAILALVGLYVFSSFYRIAVAVISPQLVSEFGIGPEALGLLGGAFFYAFALCQFPLGPMLDRIGPRIVITVFAVIGGTGAILFAVSPTFLVALSGRVLLGIGMAAMMMGTLKVFALALPPEKFSYWTGLLVSIGALGSVMAASPFAYMNQLVGWRTTLAGCGAVTVLLGIVVFRSFTGPVPSPKENTRPVQNVNRITTGQSLRIIMGSLSFWQVSAAAFCRYGTFVSIQGVWLALYLIDVASFTAIEAGNMLLIIAVSMAAGSPCAGWLYDRMPGNKKNVVLLGLGMYCLTLIPFLGLLEIENRAWYSLLGIVMGFSSGFGMLLYSYAKELFPSSLAATSMAWVNFFLMLGGAVFMQVMGNIIETWPKTGHSYPPAAYHFAFAVCFVAMVTSIVFFSFVTPVYKKGEDVFFS